MLVEGEKQANKELEDMMLSMWYCRRFLRGLQDEELLRRREIMVKITSGNVCVPFYLARYVSIVEEAINSEILGRDAVRRYERGEAVCGITGF